MITIGGNVGGNVDISGTLAGRDIRQQLPPLTSAQTAEIEPAVTELTAAQAAPETTTDQIEAILLRLAQVSLPAMLKIAANAILRRVM